MKAIIKDTGEEIEVSKVVVSGGIYHDDECYYEDGNGRRYDEQDLSVSAPIDWKRVRVGIAMKLIERIDLSSGIFKNWSEVVFEKADSLTKRLMEDIK